jgi:hypothetical protein
MTTPLGELRIDRSTVVATGGLVVVGLYLALLAFAMAQWPYDRWMLFILGPILLISGSLIIVAVTRRDEAPLTRLILVAFGLKMLSSFVRYFFTVDVYGTGDALRYDKVGAEIANDVHGGRIPLSDMVPSGTGTAFVEDLTGLIYTVTGPSRLGGFLVFSWLSFFGLVLFHRAALRGLPEGDQRRYAILVLFLPSLLFWPSSIGKEALMVLALGACAYGAARVLERQAAGWLPLGLGLGLAYLVRPHVPIVVLAALAVSFLFRRTGRRKPIFGPAARLMVVGVMVGAMAFVLGQAVERFIPRDSAPVSSQGAGVASDPAAQDGPSAVDDISVLLNRATGGTDEGDSLIDRPLPNNPLEYPAAAFTVLFRPTLIEISSATIAIAALETTVLLALFIASWKRLRNVPAMAFRRPYVLFCIVYTGVFAFAWSSFSNLGALSRQRVQVWPFVLLLLAIPVVLEKATQRQREQRHRSRLRPSPATGVSADRAAGSSARSEVML